MLKGLETILFFCPEPLKAATWYAELLSTTVQIENPNFVTVQGPGVLLGFHPEDKKNQAGNGSTIAYWQVEDFEHALGLLQTKGANLYRGPINNQDHRNLAMLTDPFGNNIGIIEVL